MGAKRKRLATESLENWGTYAVPALVELLSTSNGAEQSRPVLAAAERVERTVPSRDADVMESNRRAAANNAEIAKVAWPDGADRPPVPPGSRGGRPGSRRTTRSGRGPRGSA